MKRIIFFTVWLYTSIVFCEIKTMTFSGSSTTVSGVTFTFSSGQFTNSIDGTTLFNYNNHPYGTPLNGGGDYKDIFITEAINITSVYIPWAQNVEGFKLQFLVDNTVVKELSSIVAGEIIVNATANKIRFFDDAPSSDGGLELANVKWDTAPLPVELVSFTVNSYDKNCELLWKTETEINNYGFEIERSINPIVDEKIVVGWEKIGFVQGSGNSNSPKDYSYVDKSNLSGKIHYRLKQIDIDGSISYSDIVSTNILDNSNYNLEQNYPNPFNPSTSINYSIPESGYVTLSIYNVIGEVMEHLSNEYKNAGNYNATFSGKNLPSGIYFYKLNVNDYSKIKKMLLIK